MRLKIYGCRGSYPVSRKENVFYGGNTTSYLLESKGKKIIIDGGTGIVNLGIYLTKGNPKLSQEISLFITHTHWDHVMGLPFFQPFYGKNFNIKIYGADTETMELNNAIARQLDGQQNFPIRFQNLEANIEFSMLSSGQGIELGTMVVSSYQLNHPGRDLGYRFSEDGVSFVVLTDLAPIEDNYLGVGMAEQAEGNPKEFEKDYVNGLLRFIRGADLVIMDTNFTEEEIRGKRHWGHSTPDEAIRLFSHLDNPPALVLAHHDPNHSDGQLHEIFRKAREQGKENNIEVLIAKERGEFRL